MSETMVVFDRRAVRAHRDRAAADFGAHDFLKDEVAARLLDRLEDTTRRFERALDLGCHTGQLAARLARSTKVGTVVQGDLSAAMLAHAAGARVACDEEALPFAAGTFDLVLSALSLHWVNDLPGSLVQIRHVLAPDGLFLGAMLGGGTLAELRQVLMEAELEVEGGASPRVSPVADVAQAGQLLQRAGFALPVADADELTVTYPEPFALMRELRGMGEAGAALGRRKGFTRRETMMRAAALYRELFGDREGRVPATFQVVFLTGWAPHPCQPKPLRPGSAATRLADALGTEERSAGEHAAPGPKPPRKQEP